MACSPTSPPKLRNGSKTMDETAKTLFPLKVSGEGEAGAPATDRLISGNPVFTTWNVEERESRLYSGIWQSTPGKWRVQYDEWEYCHILSGISVLCGDDGTVLNVKAGDSFILRPGFTGTWEVIETTAKEYVVLV